MPSSQDRRRLEVPTYLYERLSEFAKLEDRTIASLVQELLHSAVTNYQPQWVPRNHSDRLGTQAKAALTLAEEEAHRLNHHYIGTEHILLGLLRATDGGAARALTRLGLTLDVARRAVAAQIGLGDEPASGKIDLTPRVRHLLALAVDEADQLGHLPILTEHILLGLVREGKGIAAFILTTTGLDLAQVRQATLNVLQRTSLEPELDRDQANGSE